jgi:hypothetical protein
MSSHVYGMRYVLVNILYVHYEITNILQMELGGIDVFKKHVANSNEIQI